MRRYTLNKYISRLMACLMVFTMMLTVLPSAKAEGESGSCGEGLSWSLNMGTLTINGSGAMSDFPESTMAPWYDLREEILRVELPGGLTHVGSLAFYGCENLTSVTIPDSVASIGSYAFATCTGLEMLTLGNVGSVAEAAFSDCVSLQALRLPGTLTSIGRYAFYRCEAITTVTIPTSVTSIGMNAFGYCKSLLSADVQASVTELPHFMFYECGQLAEVSLSDSIRVVGDYVFEGCDQLATVYYKGSASTAEEIQQSLSDSKPDTSATVTDTAPIGTTTVNTTTNHDDGTVTKQETSVVQGDDITATTKVETNSDGSVSADITVTVEGDDGWDSAEIYIQSTINEITIDNDDEKVDDVTVTVYVTGTEEVNADFIDALANQNAEITIVTENGSSWTMDMSEMDTNNLSGAYNLNYNLTAGTPELSAEMGAETSFCLAFCESAEVNSEVRIRLGTTWAQQEATLFQRMEEGLSQVQTVIVDLEGYAHFYLACVDQNIEYSIGMNLFAAENEAIVPDQLLPAYGVNVRSPIQYEITGRTSSWGMNLGQVMGILAVVMVAVIVFVGIIMFALNRRKLKMGYIPDLDDEDYD